jgi:hypothetical protein
MITLHDAIYALNPSVVTIRDDVAYDVNEQEVAYNKNDVERYVQSQTYKAKRQAEYPPITDYLDGIVKGDEAQIQSYIDACNAVKNKYPKPE